MKFVKKRYLILLTLGVSIGFYFCYSLFSAPKRASQPWIVPDVQDISKKFITEETLVNQIHQKQQLITMEVEMSESVILDDSWGTLGIFKKVQNIKYYGTGTFAVDLYNISKNSIKVDNNSRKIYVKVPKPTIKSIIIQSEKTEYQTPENGLLRFGEIEFSVEENQVLLDNIKEKMRKKLNEEEYIKEASENSKRTLEALIKGITGTSDSTSYEVSIEFEA